ncbi:mannose-1-phosphate guanylyltransferase [Novipirellula artificiosorum]|uniref:Mannose-1-phosphate guanylyltransferase n=1 Tax=Novipirellula artificiosorum TaxID=2528016 RepID=A0A5C6CYF7_9BACT|nr:mannose-1-phosphate guanylyltransferase [Novipirellula artificiosorum]TWU28955.1 Mannose-1-phosphate guanylyltransferase [Novipirellula artificiosorum]
MLNENCYAVVMAGGAGTRLWPLSSKDKPKHFLKLFGGRSLIELTVDKLRDHLPNDRILILTSTKYKAIAQETLPQIPAQNFVYEPCLRDTASAIGLAATVLKTRCPRATMVVLTADQIIEPADQFNTAIADAADFLELHPDRLIAFGVKAVSPSTLVGWQKLGDAVGFPGCEVRQIAAFTEKPELEIAERYINEGGYCWNSGQFAWKAETILQEISTHLPEAAPLLERIGDAWETPQRDQVLHELFPQMPTGSIDYKIMQKTDKACSILLPCSWEDMGTHAALANRIGSPQDGNVTFGKVVVQGTGNHILADSQRHVVVAAENLTVIVTGDTVFIGDKNTDMKALVEYVAEQAPEIV